MSVAAVVLGPGRGRGRGQSGGRGRLPALSVVAAAAAAAGYDELVVVLDDEAALQGLPESATVLLDQSKGGAAGALRVAIDWAQRESHEALTVALPPPGGPAGSPEVDAAAWRRLLSSPSHPIAVATTPAGRSALVRLAVEVWALAPLEGDPSLLLGARPELVAEIAVASSAAAPSTGASPMAVSSSEVTGSASPQARMLVAQLLGREPKGAFRVVVRDRDEKPVVIENAPFLEDGTPMPTRYWLVGRRECEAVGRLEADGGVRRASEAVAPELVEAAHRAYAASRDALITKDHRGPRPTGGVGGTRVGVKCLHAHLASYLAGCGDPVGRWVAETLRGELSGPVAAIDCGTNSTRLLIVGAAGESLERKMTITRLGEGVDQTGRLDPKAIARTVECLAGYREMMDAHAVVAHRATATSAARDAANAEEFFTAAAAVLGRPPELLAGEEEGRLSYSGATSGLDPDDGPYLVVDLGGGSTELVAGGAGPGAPVAVTSLDFGCVRVTERFFSHDPPTPDEADAARRFVADAVTDAAKRLPGLLTPRHLIGVAGTVSTLVQLSIGLDRYDGGLLQHQRISAQGVGRLAAELLAQSAAERASRPGIAAGRADVIAAGALIFSEVMTVLGHDSARYSESDILDGIAMELLGTTR